MPDLPRTRFRLRRRSQQAGAARRRSARPSPTDLVIENQDLVEIATSHLDRLVRSPAIDRDDLRGEGQLALIHAARRYDPARGSFRSYAFRRVKGAMLDAIRRDHFLPRYARDRGHRVVVVSIERPINDKGVTISDTLVDVRPSVEEVVEQREQLAAAIAGHGPARRASRLTPSELEVLRGAALGETAEETADRLRKSIDTIKTHRRRALRRLGARSIAQAVFIAHDEIAA